MAIQIIISIENLIIYFLNYEVICASKKIWYRCAISSKNAKLMPYLIFGVK